MAHRSNCTPFRAPKESTGTTAAVIVPTYSSGIRIARLRHCQLAEALTHGRLDCLWYHLVTDFNLPAKVRPQ